MLFSCRHDTGRTCRCQRSRRKRRAMFAPVTSVPVVFTSVCLYRWVLCGSRFRGRLLRTRLPRLNEATGGHARPDDQHESEESLFRFTSAPTQSPAICPRRNAGKLTTCRSHAPAVVLPPPETPHIPSMGASRQSCSPTEYRGASNLTWVVVDKQTQLKMSHGLEFVERRGQPFQSTIVSDEVEME